MVSCIFVSEEKTSRAFSLVEPFSIFHFLGLKFVKKFLSVRIVVFGEVLLGIKKLKTTRILR